MRPDLSVQWRVLVTIGLTVSHIAHRISLQARSRGRLGAESPGESELCHYQVSSTDIVAVITLKFQIKLPS